MREMEKGREKRRREGRKGIDNREEGQGKKGFILFHSHHELRILWSLKELSATFSRSSKAHKTKTSIF
jgi:hypothetical protein